MVPVLIVTVRHPDSGRKYGRKRCKFSVIPDKMRHMANLTLIYGLRLLPEGEVKEIGDATLKLANGNEAHVTMHVLEGSREEMTSPTNSCSGAPCIELSRPSSPGWLNGATLPLKYGRSLPQMPPTIIRSSTSPSSRSAAAGTGTSRSVNVYGAVIAYVHII